MANRAFVIETYHVNRIIMIFFRDFKTSCLEIEIQCVILSNVLQRLNQVFILALTQVIYKRCLTGVILLENPHFKQAFIEKCLEYFVI